MINQYWLLKDKATYSRPEGQSFTVVITSLLCIKCVKSRKGIEHLKIKTKEMNK